MMLREIMVTRALQALVISYCQISRQVPLPITTSLSSTVIILMKISYLEDILEIPALQLSVLNVMNGV
jgi:hypothetical protein